MAYVPARFLHARNWSAGSIKGVYCSHDGRVGLVINYLSKCSQHTKLSRMIQSDRIRVLRANQEQSGSPIEWKRFSY